MSKVLFCTVGTGDITRLVETLLTPLKMSIAQGEWEEIVLLPSQLTAQFAELLKTEVANAPIRIAPLPIAEQENNLDACFAHFDALIREQLAEGCTPEELVADFTRGTKAMSAALVLAAVRNNLPLLRYIVGTRNEQGTVLAGTEIVGEFQTHNVMASRRIDDAYLLFAKGNFAGVQDLLDLHRQYWPQNLSAQAVALRALARFYGAWDRLNYSEAARMAANSEFQTHLQNLDLPVTWLPTAPQLEWINLLAENEGLKGPIDADMVQSRGELLRNLALDLFANGERRLMQHQFEDALLRAYRIVELLGQARLLDYGLDSAALPPEDPRIQSFQEKMQRDRSEALSVDARTGMLQAPREKVARLLKHLGDKEFGQRLITFTEQGEVKAKHRNLSVLIHGFQAMAGAARAPLQERYDALLELLNNDRPHERVANNLNHARFPFLKLEA